MNKRGFSWGCGSWQTYLAAWQVLQPHAELPAAAGTAWGVWHISRTSPLAPGCPSSTGWWGPCPPAGQVTQLSPASQSTSLILAQGDQHSSPPFHNPEIPLEDIFFFVFFPWESKSLTSHQCECRQGSCQIPEKQGINTLLQCLIKI